MLAEATGGSFPRTEINVVLVIIILILSVAAKTIRDSKVI